MNYPLQEILMIPRAQSCSLLVCQWTQSTVSDTMLYRFLAIRPGVRAYLEGSVTDILDDF